MAVSNVTLGVHLSSKTTPYVDVPTLVKNGVRFVICDMGGGYTFDPNKDQEGDTLWAKYDIVQKCWDNDIPVFGVWNFFSKWSTAADDCVAKQLKALNHLMENKNLGVSGLFIQLTEIKDDRGALIAPAWINQRPRLMRDETEKAHARVWTGIYTGGGITSQYPALDNWLGHYGLYWAWWQNKGPQNATWSQLAGYYPTVTPNNIPSPFADSPNPNNRGIAFWQWSDNYYNNLDGMWTDSAKTKRANARLVFFMGSETQLWEYGFYTPHSTTPPPTPNPDPTPIPTYDFSQMITLLKSIDTRLASIDQSLSIFKK